MKARTIRLRIQLKNIKERRYKGIKQHLPRYFQEEKSYYHVLRWDINHNRLQHDSLRYNLYLELKKKFPEV